MAFNLTLNAAIKSDLTEIHPLLEQKKSVQMISPSFLEKIKGFDCISIIYDENKRAIQNIWIALLNCSCITLNLQI